MKLRKWMIYSASWDLPERFGPKVFECEQNCQHGSVEAAIKDLSEQIPEFRKKVVDLGGWINSRKQLYDQCLQKSVHWCCVGDKDYPEGLLLLESPPLILSVLGELPKLESYLSVVGSRSPDPLSLNWMESEFLPFLKENPCVVVSGGARGVDQKAHGLALRASQPTMIWLPSGVLNVYPKDLQRWVLPVIKGGGCFVSAFNPLEPMKKWRFHIRNQYIAAIAQFTLVVEARRRSGTMVTASYARDLGKSVLVVPCSPVCLSGQGGLDLIFDGASLVRDRRDLSFHLGS